MKVVSLLIGLGFLGMITTARAQESVQGGMTLKEYCVAVDAELRQGNEGSAEYVEYIPVCVLDYSNGDVVISREDGEDYLKPSYLSRRECLDRMAKTKTTWCE